MQGSKRFPTAITFDADDDTTFQYMFCMANLLAVNQGMEPNRNELFMRGLARETKASTYNFKKVVVPEEKKEGEKAAPVKQEPAE